MDVAATRATVRTVAYGRPATVALADAIAAAKQRHPLDPVTVVVASNLAGLSVRRLIGGGTVGDGGLAGVSFVTPFRLAELVGGERVPGHPVTNAVLAAAVRGTLREEPGLFRRVADHPASEAALLGLYAELSHLRDDTLGVLASRSARGAGLVALFRAVRRRLTGFHDEDDLARTAAARLRNGDVATPLGRLVWFLPDRLTPALSDLLAAGIQATPTTVVLGLTGDATADTAVRRACIAAGIDLDDAAPAEPPSPTPVPVTANRIISVSDPEEEVRAVCREIAALAEAGTPLDRIGVFHPAPDPYARTVHEHLQAAGIPHNGPSQLRLADRVAGRTLLAALALPDQGWARAAVIALASDGPLRHDGEAVPVTAWDTVSREAGVVAGRDDWPNKLDVFARGRRDRHEVEADDPDASPRRLRNLLSDADRADQLAAFVEHLAGMLADLDRAATWSAKATAARSMLEQLFGPEGRRVGWPDDERAAGERVDAALTRLELLDELDPAPSTTSFARAVEAELDEPAGRVGRFGEGVLFGPLTMAPGLDLDAVFVLGMAEGTCPNPRREDGLLPDDDRLATRGELLCRDEGLHDQHRRFLAALAAGATHRVLLFPRGDLRGGRTRLPSRWLLDTATALAGARVHSSDFADLDLASVTTVKSFSNGLETATVAASPADRDLLTLHRHLCDGGDPATHPFADPPLRGGLQLAVARASERFTEWDGNLHGFPVPSPTNGKLLSATALESWAQCPFKYFLRQIVHLGERPDPEAVTVIGAADRGSLVHEVLERFFREVLDRPGGPPGPASPWTDADRERLRALAGEVFERYEAEGKTGRPLTWRRRREDVLTDLDHVLDSDDRHRAATGATPVQVELPFGLDGAPPLVLDLGGGRRLNLRGRADRVDETASGRHLVLDYKTGKADSYKKLAVGDPVREGLTLQLGLYAEAARSHLGARDVSSAYWMISEVGGFKQYGYPWDDERRERFLDVLGAITDGIEAGTFPARPGRYDAFRHRYDRCGYCDFDRLCPRDRDDHEQAKAGAPELAVLERLRDPAAAEAIVEGQGS